MSKTYREKVAHIENLAVFALKTLGALEDRGQGSKQVVEALEVLALKMGLATRTWKRTLEGTSFSKAPDEAYQEAHSAGDHVADHLLDPS